jgi:hypothetical protein
MLYVAKKDVYNFHKGSFTTWKNASKEYLESRLNVK